MQTSIKGIADIMEGFATDHLNIKRFKADFEEQLDSFANEEKTFPVMFMILPTGDSQRYVDNFVFDIIVLDQISEGRENVLTIVSDCHLILTDLFKWIKESETLEIDIADGAQRVSENNSRLDGLAGARMTCTIEVDSIGVCQLPLSSEI